MGEWLYEDGVGERRAVLVQNGIIVEAQVEWDGDGPLPGTISAAQLVAVHLPGRRGLIRLADGAEALLEPIPAGLAEGGGLTVEIVRAAIPEAGRAKPARARASDAESMPGPSLHDRIAATGLPVRTLARHTPDLLEAAGWSELLEEAASGQIAFPGGALRLSPTPAMTLFDVDGGLPPVALALAGAAAAARAIRRLDIGGSIGIDLPTVSAKAERQAAAAAIDAILPPPFERTAVNGFGFIQIVRRRTRMSLPERMRAYPAAAAARALLRRAERAGGIGTRTLIAHPAVLAAIEPAWLATLARRIGAAVALRPDPARAISAGDVVSEHP